MSLEFQDKAGNPLKRGDFIVYGHALGRCAGLRYGVVVEIKEGKVDWSQTGPKLHVFGIDDDWDHRAPTICRKGVLSFSSRVLKVRKDQIPLNQLSLLEKALGDL